MSSQNFASFLIPKKGIKISYVYFCIENFFYIQNILDTAFCKCVNKKDDNGSVGEG